MTKLEIDRAFTASWCGSVLDRLARSGFTAPTPEYPQSYRTNDRWVADDPALADEVLAAARPHLPATLVDEAGIRWRLSGLNPRMRACRYRAGQWFGPHRDGVHWQSARERSWLSVLVYLDDGFRGGDTRVFADRHGARVVRRIVPARGKLAIFDHTLWHDGAPVEAGTKHVLRTDVMYTRDGEAEDGHLGYVWSLAALADGGLASGGRDRSIRLWRGGRPAGVVRDAHAGSVTCLAAHPGGLISGSRDRTVSWWARGGDGLVRQRTVEAHAGAVLSVASDEVQVVSAGADGKLVWHDGATRTPRVLAAHDGWAWSVCSLRDGLGGGGGFASVGDDGRLVLAAGGRVRAAVEPLGPGRPLRAVCALADGLHVAVGALDGTIGIVRVADRGLVGRWVAHDGAVTALAPLLDGGVLSGGEDDGARRWSASGACLESRAHHDFVRAVCALEGGWASAGYDGVVRVGRSTDLVRRAASERAAPGKPPAPVPRTRDVDSVIG